MCGVLNSFCALNHVLSSRVCPNCSQGEQLTAPGLDQMERRGLAFLKLHRAGLHVDIMDSLLSKTRAKMKLFSSLCHDSSLSLAVCREQMIPPLEWILSLYAHRTGLLSL